MTLFILSLVLGQIWLLSGLLINALQLLMFLTVKPFNINIYRRINYYLTYSMWSQVVTMAEWLSGSKVNIFYPDVESEFYFDKEHTLCVANHKYELDWLWAWLAADKFHNLGVSEPLTFSKFIRSNSFHFQTLYIRFRIPKASPRSLCVSCQSWDGVGTSVNSSSSHAIGTKTNRSLVLL